MLKTDRILVDETGIKRTPEKTLLRATAFLLVFLTAHWLLLWAHPFGEHRFF
jgi:hypothetical protein